MCLAKAYLSSGPTDSDGELVLENVTRVQVEGDQIYLTSLLGDARELTGRVRRIDFTEGRLIVESIPQPV